MQKILCAAAATAVLLMQPAHAAMECGAMLSKYGTMASKMEASGSKRAQMYRMVLKGYDSCKAGDEFNAMKFWRMVEANTR